jgi:hypothetical protein
VPINVAFFRFFVDGDAEYLSRAWLLDPTTADGTGVTSTAGEPWNGEVYASFGHREHRRWHDGMRYGYIAAGGGPWYVNTLIRSNPVNVHGQRPRRRVRRRR